MYIVNKVQGVPTNAVKGELTAREALERMLAGTTLKIVEDGRTGALAVHPRSATEAPVEKAPRPETAPVKKTAATEDAGQDSIVLSPFTVRVEKDTGYVAADVISAGLLSTNLLKTPSDITVLTRDFLNDIGTIDINEAALFLTSSDVTFPQERDFASNTSFRGLVSSGTKRNFFQSAYTPEEYVTERLEGARGPNSILYGDSNLGGQQSVISKRAAWQKNFTSVRTRFDSEGSTYLSLDSNHIFSPKLAVRVLGQAGNGKAWTDDYFDNRYGGFVAITYRPWKGAEVRFEGELGYTDRLNRVNFFTDQTSAWDRTTVYTTPVATAPTGSGTTRLGNFYVWVPRLGGVMNYAGFGRSSGLGLSVINDGSRGGIANFPVLPRKSASFQPKQMHTPAHSKDAALFLEQAFDSGFVIEAAANFSGQWREGMAGYYQQLFVDVNKKLPDGRDNPYFGKNYTINTAGVNAQTSSNDYYTGVRLASAYPIKTDKFSILVSPVLHYREHLFRAQSWQCYKSNGLTPLFNPTTGALNAENLVQTYNYWDEPVWDMPLPQSDGTNQFRYVKVRDASTIEKWDSAQINAVGHFLRDRLTLITGFRYDRYEGDTRNMGARFPTEPDRYNWVYVSTKPQVQTKSFGISYFPIQQLGAYINWSEGFRNWIVNTPPLDPRRSIALANNKGFNAGLRFNLAQGRVVGGLGYYRSTELNKFVQVAAGNINTIWRNMNRDNDQIVLGSSQYLDSQDTFASGYEGEITFNLVKGFRLGGNIAFPETSQTNSLPSTKAYLAQNLSLWQAATNDPALSAAARATIATQLASFLNTISAFADGRPQNGTYKYRVNLFANYDFRSGMLKGWRVGGGVNMFSRKVIGNPTGRPYDLYYADSYYLVSASMGYRTNLFKVPVDFQLNVTNLLDHADPIFTGTTQLASGVVYRNQYFYQPPRQLRFTTTLSF
ncbi:MAG: hypothetical protein HZA31_00270 [Opitutae bacterium]|nr:hypothetical protein [Opitutae bacterium]